jgi:hypothetical protein
MALIETSKYAQRRGVDGRDTPGHDGDRVRRG